MELNAEVVTLNGVEYVKKDSRQPMAPTTDGMEYVICRTYSAGVFAAYLKSHDSGNAVLVNARRLWKWYGAMECCQLAMDGIKKSKENRISVTTNEVRLTNVIEIQPCTIKAKKSIESEPEWKM
jgi:hypothetical protein